MCDRKDITTRKRDYHLARGNTETDRKTKTNTKKIQIEMFTLSPRKEIINSEMQTM